MKFKACIRTLVHQGGDGVNGRSAITRDVLDCGIIHLLLLEINIMCGRHLKEKDLYQSAREKKIEGQNRTKRSTGQIDRVINPWLGLSDHFTFPDLILFWNHFLVG